MRPILTLLAFLFLAAPASAATITVDSSGDADATGCTLREAITSAWKNDDLDSGCVAGEPGHDRIEIGERVIGLDKTGEHENDNVSGTLDVHSDITIAGVDAESSVVDASALGNRAFGVSALGKLTLEGITLRGSSAPATGLGGAIVATGGGPYPNLNAALVITNSVLSDNHAGDAGPSHNGAGGGAIYASDTTVTIRDSRFEDNRAGDAIGGGSGGDGGALLLENVIATIERSAFIGNRSGNGGDSGGVAGSGGAILSLEFSNAETSVVSPDEPETEPDAPVTIVSSTFAANAVGTSSPGATPSRGLGIVTLWENLGAVDFATFSGNAPGSDALDLGYAKLSNSVFDAGESCPYATYGNGGGNVSAEPGCMGGDETLDLGLRPLADGLLIPDPGSPLIDAAGAGTCPADQRGVERPRGAACDAGAVEYRPASFTLAQAQPFGSVLLGTQAAQKLLVQVGDGDGPVTVNGLALGGTHPGDFAASGCIGELSPGARCEISASFAPTAAGARSATLTASTSSGDASTALSGTGTAPQSSGDGTTTPTGNAAEPQEQVSRASIAGAALRRKGKRVRLHVKLACLAGTRCAERLVADLTYGKRKRRLVRTVEVAAGKTASYRLQLPASYAKRLKKGPRVRVKLALRRVGHSDVTRSFRLRMR